MRSPEEELAGIRARDLYRRLRRFEEGEEKLELEFEGRRLVSFASNDYLGLAGSPHLRRAFAEAAERHGAGTGASRLIVGTRGPHAELEEELADFKGTERALTFSSGYATALSVIPAIVGKGDIVILDKLCHACLIDGARLSDATIRVFPHNDLEKLQSHLEWARERVGKDGRILVLTESVFSMDGDMADLAMIVQLKTEAGALLLVDEAHAVGLYGQEGRGVANLLEVDGQVDFHMGTLSKAIGVSGGYLCARAAWIDLFINTARGFIYSTAPPAAVAETARESIRLIRGREGDDLRKALWLNGKRLEVALDLSRHISSPIQPLLIGESSDAVELSDRIRDHGYLVPAIRFPTVPRGTARLRVSLSSAHTAAQIDGLGRVLRQVLQERVPKIEAS